MMRFIPLMMGGLLAAFGVFTVFHGVSTPTSIVSFAREEVVSQFIRQLAERKATESQVEQSIGRFNAVLNKVLVDTAQQQNLLILNKKDVLVGSMDITDEIRMKLSRAMRSAS